MAADRVEPYARLAGVYDEIVVDPCYPRWADFIVDRFRSSSAAVDTVLDVCCGTGLLAAELVSHGYRVVGVDSSPAMLTRAEALLGPEATLVAATLPELGVDTIFDAAISTFDGLNYLTRSDLGLSLAAIAERVRPDGWFIFDLHTDTMMRFTAANPVVSGEAAGNRFVITSEVDQIARSCDTTIEVIEARRGEPFSERHRQYFHSAETVRAELAAAGFDDVQVFDEYSDQPIDDVTLRATWTARRSTRHPRRLVETTPGTTEGR
ncbi:MAG: hypothetical protein QG671_58 [Actinomycetota bacterium]|nr:hypothetical protein [Actinomycetota bacterium]